MSTLILYLEEIHLKNGLDYYKDGGFRTLYEYLELLWLASTSIITGNTVINYAEFHYNF